jgi:prophage regulatory protein
MPIKRMYRIAEVSDITGLKPSTIYKLIRLNKFPRGTKLTSRSTGWLSTSIDDWLEKQISGGNA